MSNAVAVTDATFETEVIKSEDPVLVDFWAEWCGPCKMMAPVLDDVSREQTGHLKVVKLDVDSNPAISERYQIQSIPTLVLFKSGVEVDRAIGYMNKAQLMRAFGRHLG